MNRELPASASRPEHTGDTETPHPNPHLGRRLTERPDPARMRVGVGSADTNGLTWLLDLAERAEVWVALPENLAGFTGLGLLPGFLKAPPVTLTCTQV